MPSLQVVTHPAHLGVEGKAKEQVENVFSKHLSLPTYGILMGLAPNRLPRTSQRTIDIKLWFYLQISEILWRTPPARAAPPGPRPPARLCSPTQPLTVALQTAGFHGLYRSDPSTCSKWSSAKLCSLWRPNLPSTGTFCMPCFSSILVYQEFLFMFYPPWPSQLLSMQCSTLVIFNLAGCIYKILGHKLQKKNKKYCLW